MGGSIAMGNLGGAEIVILSGLLFIIIGFVAAVIYMVRRRNKP
jgi:flagellar biogenesis protein FliO